MSALTLVSRASGFVRVVVVAAVLGAAALGNTYQTANTVPNIVFELLAAGTLSAAVVPALVRSDNIDKSGLQRLSRELMTGVLVVLVPTAIVVGLLGNQIFEFLFRGVTDEVLRAEQVDLASFWLWLFVPQIVLYGCCAVATAVLTSREKLSAIAIAPLANNVVVIGVYLIVAAMGDSGGGVAIDTAEKLVLGIGTTAGVVVMTAVPLIALKRTRISVVPSWPKDWAPLLAVAKAGLWFGLVIVATQVQLVVVLRLANGIDAVVAYQLALAVFLLPVSVVGVPIATGLNRRLATAATIDVDQLRAQLNRGLKVVAKVLIPSAALLIVAAPAISYVVMRGAASDDRGEFSSALMWMAIALPAYGSFPLLSRSLLALGRARMLAGISALSLCVGVGVMLASWSMSTSVKSLSIGFVAASWATFALQLLAARHASRSTEAGSSAAGSSAIETAAEEFRQSSDG